jgi:hypothetical protein
LIIFTRKDSTNKSPNRASQDAETKFSHHLKNLNFCFPAGFFLSRRGFFNAFGDAAGFGFGPRHPKTAGDFVNGFDSGHAGIKVLKFHAVHSDMRGAGGSAGAEYQKKDVGHFDLSPNVESELCMNLNCKPTANNRRVTA